MADPLKTFFSRKLVRELAAEIERVHPAFPSTLFVKRASAGLDELELLARGRHIASALATALPSHYPEAVDVLLRSLGPEHSTDELIGAGMAPFRYLPHTLFVAEHGLDHFDLSMQAQYELTKRFSAESSVRAFIARHPERTFEVLATWSTDSNPHVRRLVSEGTRLRLPWAMRVRWLDEHPARIVELLERLKDDPATLVRRSVANNLNDIGKVHPELLIRTCKAWRGGASPERRALIEHAMRSAIKRGDPQALALVGYATAPRVAIERVTFSPRRVRIGDRVAVTFSLRNLQTKPQELLVDMAVRFVKARDTGRKVFKLKRLTLGPRERVTLSTSVSLAIHTTRVPRPGRHDVEIVLNGIAKPIGFFSVAPAR